MDSLCLSDVSCFHVALRFQTVQSLENLKGDELL
jgi:hypothetical protein